MKVSNKIFGVVLAAAAAVSAQAAPIVIGGVTYVTSINENLTAPFSSITGVSTTNSYSGFVLLTVSGVGQSLLTQFNDAFYLYTDASGAPIAPVTDPNYFQIRFSGSPMVVYDPTKDAKNYIVYDATANVQVASPYVPAYTSTHVYSFVVNSASLTKLFFGVSDGEFFDNTGAYVISVSQLVPSTSVPEPTSAALLLLVSGVSAAMLRRRIR